MAEETEQEFDHGKALSERDKKIAQLEAQLKEKEQQLPAAEPISELGVSDATDQPANSDDPFSKLEDRLTQINERISTLQQGAFDTQFSLEERISDDGFKKWASETRYSQFDHNSPTLEEVLVEARNQGNFQLANSILGQYDRTNRENTSPKSPSTPASKPPTAEQKKTQAEIAAKMTERKRLIRAGDDKGALKITEEIRELKRNN